MTLFYDPEAKKPHPWIPTFFLILPLLIACISFLYGQKRFNEKINEEKRRAQIDVFEKF